MVVKVPSAGAQVAPVEQPPAISVNARGEVEVAPDRARVQVGVETQAKTSAAAAAENNKKQSAVLKAIRDLGIPQSQIRTVGYNVMPIQRYDDKLKRTVIDGYQVSNIVSVETEKLELAGQIIDAGLANGANRVAGLDFFVKDKTKAQEEALAQAVASARKQAEVAARAAGGQIAGLLEVIVNEFDRPEPRPMLAMAKMSMDAAGAPTEVSAGTSTISVSVMTRWRFSAR